MLLIDDTKLFLRRGRPITPKNPYGFWSHVLEIPEKSGKSCQERRTPHELYMLKTLILKEVNAFSRKYPSAGARYWHLSHSILGK